MRPSERAARKWDEEHIRRDDDERFKWVQIHDHPVVQEWINTHYYDGVGPWKAVRPRLPAFPVGRALELGCGRGELALRLKAEGWFDALDAYDLSGSAIEIAERRAQTDGAIGLRFRVADMNALALPKNTYPFIYAQSALHHFENLEHIYKQVHDALTEDGVFFVTDYVGPSRMQWTDAQLALANQVLQTLPAEYRSILGKEPKLREHVRRIPIENFLARDPSEGVRAAEIVPLAREHFDLMEIKFAGPSFLRPTLRNIVHNFRADSIADRALLESLLLMEKALIDHGVVEANNAYFIARRRSAG